MKRIAWGIVAGGAVAAAFSGAATANATGDTWTPSYDVDNAQLFLGPDQSSAAWELPASFTNGSTTLTGTDYLATSAGGFDDEFITKSGALYDQNQLGGGFTNLYYFDPSSSAAAVDMMKTPFGVINLSSVAWLFAPRDFEATTSPAGPVGDHNVGAALGLYQGIGGLWTGSVDSSELTALQAPDSSSLVWSVPATYTGGGSLADPATLSGTEYVLSPTETEFVTSAGVFDEKTYGFIDNLYFDPTDGPAKDFLQTPLGLIDLSSVASWFAPADVSDLTAASPLTDLADAGLYSALDLAPGLTP